MNIDGVMKTTRLLELPMEHRNSVTKALAAIVFLLAPFCVAGQTPGCKVGKDAPAFGFWTWASGSMVRVYVLDDQFDAADLPYLLKPLANWNAVGAETESRVKFDYAGLTATPVHCDNCLTIRRGDVFDVSRRHLTELISYSAAGNRIITWGTITIDPLLTNPKALTNAVAHELGHSFGLLDCYSCKQKSTVMIQFETVNASNEMDGPTVCDVAEVKRVYQALAAPLKRLPKSKPIVIDEGEEPVEDDTPIVVRKP